jgi:hypothetical protein
MRKFPAKPTLLKREQEAIRPDIRETFEPQRAYRKRLMKNGFLKIRFDLISDDGLEYQESCYAHASPELTLDLHSANGYRVQFNNDPKNPQIVAILEKAELPRLGGKAVL